MLRAISRLPLALMRAVVRLVAKLARVAAIASALFAAVFILDMLFLGDTRRDSGPRD